MPRRVSARVKPSPMPMPSKSDATGVFLAAKASARPRMMQFTTMRGMNRPSALSMSGRKALMTICRMVTKAAMTTMNTGMRTLSGVRLFSSEMTKLVQMSTTMVARPIDRPFRADVVVARVGHMPSIRTKVGFSLTMPFLMIFA